MSEASNRLDSWKAIADYLGRDVSTVMRWSKSNGLPVHRVAGGRGRSVFAFSHEIDAWLAGHQHEKDRNEEKTPERARWRVMAPVAALAVIAAVIAVAVSGTPVDRTLDAATLRVEMADRAVMLRDGTGLTRTIHQLDANRIVEITPTIPQLHDADADGARDVLVGVSFYIDPGSREPSNGELLNLSLDGAVRWRYSIEGQFTFRDDRFGGPWGLTDWAIGPAASPARIAVTAHDTVWWASVVAMLDHDGRQRGAFVHPGWIESVRWLDSRRLVVGGFSNMRDAGIVAVLDADQIDGQAPDTKGTPFECTSCPRRSPAFYAAFPRSEVNRVSGSRFNRALVGLVGDRIVVRTTEAGESGDTRTSAALYEFDREMRLLRARYDDRYWDMHRQLEMDGKLNHSRNDCEWRDGPGRIDVWTGTGWERRTPNL